MSDVVTDDEIANTVSGATIEELTVERNNLGILTSIEIELQNGDVLKFDDGEISLKSLIPWNDQSTND